MFFRKTGAFTLIELLIVVAIIAILALIAVPNFLEAQVRAKVSRVKSDLRSLATAEEAYMVDWNSYTNSNTEAENPGSIGTDDPRGKFYGFEQLTTPIAYITSIPMDAFGQSRYVPTPGGWRPAYFSLGTGEAGSRLPSGPQDSPKGGMPSNCYEIESDGPDHWDDTRSDTPYGIGLSTGDFPWQNIVPNSAQHIAALSALCYDPTNGTVSGGEIMRVGGTKPAGAAYDALWSGTSK